MFQGVGSLFPKTCTVPSTGALHPCHRRENLADQFPLLSSLFSSPLTDQKDAFKSMKKWAAAPAVILVCWQNFFGTTKLLESLAVGWAPPPLLRTCIASAVTIFKKMADQSAQSSKLSFCSNGYILYSVCLLEAVAILTAAVGEMPPLLDMICIQVARSTFSRFWKFWGYSVQHIISFLLSATTAPPYPLTLN